MFNRFDYNLLGEYFDTLKYDRDYIFYQKIMMLGLEGCIFEKDSKNRPVLAGLRFDYGKKRMKIVKRQKCLMKLQLRISVG